MPTKVPRSVDYINIETVELVPGSQKKGNPDSPEFSVEIPPIRVLEWSHKVPEPNINWPENITSSISFFKVN